MQTMFAEVGSKIVTITMCAVLIYELIGPVLTKWALTKAGEIDKSNLQRKSRVAFAHLNSSASGASAGSKTNSAGEENKNEK